MKQIVRKFNIEGKVNNITSLFGGLINKTYLVETDKKKYLLQRINKYVFNNPIDVMSNISKITQHIKEKHEPTINIIKSNDKDYCIVNDEYYRLYDYMDKCCNNCNHNYSTCLEAGKAVGKFQYLLFDFNPLELVETIHNFHNLSSRIEQLKIAYHKLPDDDERKIQCEYLYSYIIKEANNNKSVEDKIENGIIPIRIVHNDTKLNNIMFDKKTNKAITLIDLDTVMPGSILYDYGDMIRATSTYNDENETNTDNIKYDDQLFIALTIGYLSKMYDKITYDEVKELVNVIGVITLECSSRFLTDYLSYDKYFIIQRKGQKKFNKGKRAFLC